MFVVGCLLVVVCWLLFVGSSVSCVVCRVVCGVLCVVALFVVLFMLIVVSALFFFDLVFVLLCVVC